MPIKLNVIIPQNNFTKMAEKVPNLKDQMENLRRSTNSREIGNEYFYTDNWRLNGPSTTAGNQVYHEMSGYYVVKSVTHTITKNSYDTTLNIMSYPNIQNDIFEKVNK